MNAKDFRIGNLVEYDNRIFEIDTIAEEFPTLNTDEFGIGVVSWANIKPIPLTEDWLLKFGFKKINHIYGYYFWSLSKGKIDIYEKKTTFRGYSVLHIEHVHQLQNLYYALTGEELNLKK